MRQRGVLNRWVRRRPPKSSFDLKSIALLTRGQWQLLTKAAAAKWVTVAEYCPDGDYRSVVDEYARTRPPLDRVLDDFHQILDGLEVLHTKILHRDLKPENVLRQGNVKKLADFGLAKFVDQATRRTSAASGVWQPAMRQARTLQ